MENKEIAISELHCVWYRGLIPALIAGIGTYLITRKYQIDGFVGGLDAAGSSLKDLADAVFRETQ